MTTLLITRPQEKTEPLASLLEERGFRVFLEPLLKIERLDRNAPALAAALARPPQAVLATSGSGVEALAAMSDIRAIPLLVVGEATARRAKALGFSVPAYAETANGLAALAAARCDPASGRLLYVRGAQVNTDLRATLKEKKFNVDEMKLYRAAAARKFSASLRKAITDGGIDGALFFSARTAAAYASLARPLASHHAGMTAYCLSETVAGKLRALPWQDVRVAEAPDTAHMLMLLQRWIIREYPARCERGKNP